MATRDVIFGEPCGYAGFDFEYGRWISTRPPASCERYYFTAELTQKVTTEYTTLKVIPPRVDLWIADLCPNAYFYEFNVVYTPFLAPRCDVCNKEFKAGVVPGVPRKLYWNLRIENDTVPAYGQQIFCCSEECQEVKFSPARDPPYRVLAKFHEVPKYFGYDQENRTIVTAHSVVPVVPKLTKK